MWIPPYLPSFLPLSLKHTLSKTANKVYVSVAIKVMLIDQLLLLHLFVVTLSEQVPEVCPEYSEAVFDVILKNTTGMDRIWRQNALQETREQLAEDQVYLLYVESNGEQLTTQQRIGEYSETINCTGNYSTIKWRLTYKLVEIRSSSMRQFIHEFPFLFTYQAIKIMFAVSRLVSQC